MLKGIAASAGTTIVKVYRLETSSSEIVKTKATPAKEVAEFNATLEKMKSDIEGIRERAAKRLAPEELAVLDAHLMMAGDPELASQIISMIENDKVNAEFATNKVANIMVTMSESMGNECFKERAADVKDVTFRLKCSLLGLMIPGLSAINEDSVIIAHDLTSPDTAQLNEYAKGFAMNIGGKTGYSATMANPLGIPAVVGCGGVLDAASNGDTVILGTLDGVVILNPTAEEIREYEGKRVAYMEEEEALKVLKDAKSITTDGREVKLAENIDTPDDIEGALNNGGEGIGLYRTEFLYMHSDYFPTEDEQFEAYKAALEGMGGRRAVVCILDIGGDKKLPYSTFDPEMNPFLGYRAICLYLDRTEILRTQLRVLIRAPAYGRLRIMSPMIAMVDEFRQGKAIFEEEREKPIAEGVKVVDKIEVGMMVEIPAAIVNADNLAKEADFPPIGTNDLIQYPMTAGRMNEKVFYLYQPHNPSILCLIRMTIDGAHKEGEWAGMCGAMAGEEYAIPVLLGLGLDEFSTSAAQILKARKMATNLSKKEMEGLAEEALKQATAEDVLAPMKKAVE